MKIVVVGKGGREHALVRALKSIAVAVGAPDVPSGDGWAERVAAVIGAIAADRERAVGEARWHLSTVAKEVEKLAALLRALGVEA